MRNTPYTTSSGLQIGLRAPAPRPEQMDRDALRVQEALMYQPAEPDLMQTALYIVYALCLVVVALTLILEASAK